MQRRCLLIQQKMFMLYQCVEMKKQLDLSQIYWVVVTIIKMTTLAKKYLQVHLLTGMNLAVQPKQLFADKLAQLVAESREGLMGCRKLCEQPIKARGDNL